jgi:hypothetical protein
MLKKDSLKKTSIERVNFRYFTADRKTNLTGIHIKKRNYIKVYTPEEIRTVNYQLKTKT